VEVKLAQVLVVDGGDLVFHGVVCSPRFVRRLRAVPEKPLS
jgi:hypothetical protein